MSGAFFLSPAAPVFPVVSCSLRREDRGALRIWDERGTRSIIKGKTMQKNNHLLSRLTKQRYFSSRDLQFSIALLVVLALLAGIFLQTVSSALITHYGMSSPVLAVFLAAGYIGIVLLLAVFFTFRLVGPFRRLEYEMKLIQAGDLSKRLSVRTQDDLHIRNFVNYVNSFVAGFEGAKKEEERLRGEILARLDEIAKEIESGKAETATLCPELKELIAKVRKTGGK